MAYPSEHYLLAFGGPLSTNEQWSCTLRMSAAFAAQDQAGEEAALEGIVQVLTFQWAQQNPVSGDARVSFVKYNRVGVDGKYTRETTNQVDIAPPLLSAAGGVHPLQIALVATLETSVERGLANKGRIYLPSPWYPCSEPNRTISAGSAQGAATWVAGLITALNDVAGVGTVIVASKTRAGAIRPVTGVNVGTVLDTMRSRRTSLLESRQSALVDGGGLGGDF